MLNAIIFIGVIISLHDRRDQLLSIYVYILRASMAPGISTAYYRLGRHDIITYYIGILQSDNTRSCPQDIMKQQRT